MLIVIASILITPAQALSPLWVFGLPENDQYGATTEDAFSGSHFLNCLAISDNGKTIAAGTYDGSIYLLNETGGLLWNGPVICGTCFINSFRLSSYGNYLAVSDSCSAPASNPAKSIRLMHRSGETLWNYPVGTFVFHSAISSNGSCTVFGSYDTVTCFDENGSSLWNYPINVPVTSLDLSEDEKSTVAVLDHASVICLNMSGGVVWKQDFRAINDMKMSGDGKYVCLISSKILSCLDREGATLWERSLPRNGIMLDVSDAGNIIVVRTSGGVCSYDLSGNNLWDYRSESLESHTHPLSPPPMTLSEDGMYTAFISGQSLIILTHTGISAGNFSCEEPLSGVAISSGGEEIVAITENDLYFFKNPAYAPASAVTTNARQIVLDQPDIGEKVTYRGSESAFSVFYKPAILPYVLGAFIIVTISTVYYLVRRYRRNGAR